MPSDHQPLFSTSFLRAHWQHDFDTYLADEDEAIRELLGHWADKDFQKETTAEGAFADVFFKKLWGFVASGERPKKDGYTLYPKYPVPGAGQEGGTGEADMAAGYFSIAGVSETAQVLCEFKDVRSGLDQPQNRKGNNRSPVKQCFDYLKHVARPLYGSEPIQPTWGLVTDMNEFRLYHYNTGPSQYQRFMIRRVPGVDETTLLEDTPEAAFQRFLFVHLCHSDRLLTRGGLSSLAQLLGNQWVHEKALEKEFYSDYHAYRDAVFEAIVQANPGFEGTKGKLVRLTQRFLDRCIFILYCEDMGEMLGYPPSLLRDLLQGISTSGRFYNPDDDAAWTQIKRLFVAMRDGDQFGENKINRFNGGLFEDNPDLDGLKIPTKVFCSKDQTTPQSLAANKETLLYFSASYNFGMRDAGGEKAIDLYTLGRIFEQSITDLEKMEAEADGRLSLMTLTKRKSDGVYYTPEWVTHYIVQETVGTRINDAKVRHGIVIPPQFDRKLIGRYNSWQQSKRKKGESGPTESELRQVYRYEQSLIAFQNELESLKVVDPACGSGAFLIQAFDHLMEQRRWVADEMARLKGQQLALFDTDATMRSILANNIYGVDINQESVEITRLALWLRTALPDRPLTSLDNNIRCGNSLIGHDFYRSEQGQFEFSEEEKERINAFDWEAAFPQVFPPATEKKGFDCVVGNPPYVKLQHFRQYQPRVAEYLLNAKRDGHPLYASTQTGNFDMFLPFIEKGIELLNPSGRMGYIAPNVWSVNDYGEGLRSYLAANHRLDRWIDFKSFQVFDEAITYTALQFYRRSPADGVQCVLAPHGEVQISSIEWSDVPAIPYAELPSADSWTLLPEAERRLKQRLASSFPSLGDAANTKHIFQGLIPSPNWIYHLQKLGPGRYRQVPEEGDPRDVDLEDQIMHPLVSGVEAKRYQVPRSETYILFPYDLTGASPRLFTPQEMDRRFHQAWTYLCEHERTLRDRERGLFDNDRWYQFARNQNLDKQNIPKLGVAETAPELRVFYDERGEFYFDNVRVNGIVPADSQSPWYLLACLNSTVANFVFKLSAKPKQNGYFEANKQFIAPLPIPQIDDNARTAIGDAGRELHALHTSRRDAIVQLENRLANTQAYDDPKPVSWLWADVHDKDYWKATNPEVLSGQQLRSWAKKHFEGASTPTCNYSTFILGPCSIGRHACGQRIESAD